MIAFRYVLRGATADEEARLRRQLEDAASRASDAYDANLRLERALKLDADLRRVCRRGARIEFIDVRSFDCDRA